MHTNAHTHAHRHTGTTGTPPLPVGAAGTHPPDPPALATRLRPRAPRAVERARLGHCHLCALDETLVRG
eukprot:1841014-Pleurochrysis_carterae.AAC.1